MIEGVEGKDKEQFLVDRNHVSDCQTDAQEIKYWGLKNESSEIFRVLEMCDTE